MSEGETKPVKASQLKPGTYVLVENEVFIVKGVEKSKSGKHGHAKIRFSAENIVSGNKKSLVLPGDDKLKSPIIDKRTAQVISVSGDFIQLMDSESFEMFDTSLPDYEEIGGQLVSGDNVDYWGFMGQKVIKRKR